MRRIALLPVMFFLWTSLAAGEVTPVPAEPLPVRKVVFYKHGMGYIEREGKIKDNATVSLSFRADQMKDLLTSFFALDLGGGKISSVQYETRDPLSKQLQDILITVPEQAALSQFLAQLKGARLTAKAAGESVAGRILGIEPINEIVGNQEVRKGYRLVLLTDAGPIRSLDLFAVSEFTLADEALQRDLRRLMDLSLDSKYTNRKKLTLSATGQGERDLRIGYLIEMPIWKCSYRIIFDEKKKDASPLLQGWALAENTTEDDWKDVRISFVAGNPNSYVMDLYSPYYVRRAQVPIPGLQGLAVNWAAVSSPDLMDDSHALESELKEEKAPAAARGAPHGAGGGGRGGGGHGGGGRAQSMDQPAAPAAPPLDNEKGMGELFASSYDAAAQGASVGELFSYEAREKVSIPRGQAAMVPIISKQINGRRLLYFQGVFLAQTHQCFCCAQRYRPDVRGGSHNFL